MVCDPDNSSGLQGVIPRCLYAVGGCKTQDGPCRVSAVDSIFLNMPNLHFLPCNPVTSKVCSCFMHWLNMRTYQHVLQVQPP